jgi:hypothetical protein
MASVGIHHTSYPQQSLWLWLDSLSRSILGDHYTLVASEGVVRKRQQTAIHASAPR